MKSHGEIMLKMLLSVALVAPVVIVTQQLRIARADPKPGLWQEAVTTADGVTVRKIRDTTGGDFNVCYVASARFSNGYSTSAGAVSLSCVPEHKP